MQIELADREKVSMLFLGGDLSFTYDKPGPITVELKTLTSDQKNQILYNYRRGALKVDNIEELRDVCVGMPAASKNFVTPSEEPITKVKSPLEIMAEKAQADKTELRNLLKEKIGVIKARTAQMPLPYIKILLQMEKDWKKRKAVVTLLENLENEKTQSVIDLLGNEDVGGKFFNPSANPLDAGQVVEETEIEEVSFNIPNDAELEKLNV